MPEGVIAIGSASNSTWVPEGVVAIGPASNAATAGVPGVPEGVIAIGPTSNVTTSYPGVPEGIVAIGSASNATTDDLAVPEGVVPEGVIAIGSPSNVTTDVPGVPEGAIGNSKPWEFLLDLESNYRLLNQSSVIISEHQYKFDCVGPKPQHRVTYLGSSIGYSNVVYYLLPVIQILIATL